MGLCWDPSWRRFRSQWSLRADTIYLNHGSFGPPPRRVQRARRRWQRQMDQQPMDFFVRQFEPAWYAARDTLAPYLGTTGSNLIFVENATVGMNLVAQSVPLRHGDQVLLTDHEYGAVKRIWQRACQEAQAELVVAKLPLPIESVDHVVDRITSAMTERTKLVVASHITSPTAITLPVEQICRAAHQRGIPVCIDGPHALAQLPLALDHLDSDFYTASCHKWLSAPFGSGFLYVHPRYQPIVQPLVLSWGRLLPEKPRVWSDEFMWVGTRDPSAYLAVGTAIEFLQEIGEQLFRTGTHRLAQYARGQLTALTGLVPLTPEDPQWYGSMAHVPLPPCDAQAVQRELWTGYGIEVPVAEFAGRQYLRVSCHLYTQPEDLDRLVGAVAELIGRRLPSCTTR